MSDETAAIERVRVLHGHTDPDSAYVVPDYPYGSLRCTIRFWIETATTGRAKGQQRFVRQTTNPKKPNHPWNKPHPSTYAGMAVLYLDGKDHVQWWSTGMWLRPEDDARARLMGIYDQLTDEQRLRYHAFLEFSHRRGPSVWEGWEQKVTTLAAEIASTGQLPETTNGVWTVPGTQRLFYLGDEDVPVYVAVAQQRLAEQG